MMGARNDLQIQFLSEADLRGVVAVKGDAFKDGEEIATQLVIPVLRNGVTVTPPASACRGDGFVHGTEQSELLRRRSIDEILSEKFVGLLVDAGETGGKIPAPLSDITRGQNDIDQI